MRYFVAGYGFVGTDFRHPNGNSYPIAWLDAASQAELNSINATRQPSFDSTTQTVDETESGFIVRALTPTELSTRTSNAKSARVAAWKKALSDKIADINQIRMAMIIYAAVNGTAAQKLRARAWVKWLKDCKVAVDTAIVNDADPTFPAQPEDPDLLTSDLAP